MQFQDELKKLWKMEKLFLKGEVDNFVNVFIKKHKFWFFYKLKRFDICLKLSEMVAKLIKWIKVNESKQLFIMKYF